MVNIHWAYLSGFIALFIALMEFLFFTGNLCMITSGCNMGRVGTIVSRERHAGSFDIVHVKDSVGHTFATR